MAQQHGSPKYGSSIVQRNDGSSVEVFGYRNTRTGELVYGYNSVIDPLADPEHIDNLGRLETFDASHQYGNTEWVRITEAVEWLGLKVAYEKEHEIMATEGGILVSVDAEKAARKAREVELRRELAELERQRNVESGAAEVLDLSEAGLPEKDEQAVADLGRLGEDAEASVRTTPKQDGDYAAKLAQAQQKQKAAAGRGHKAK